jgi:hypothetical protein
MIAGLSGNWLLAILPVLGFGINSFMLKATKALNLIRWVEIAGLVYVLIGMLMVFLINLN